jgi:hypothetical protein
MCGHRPDKELIDRDKDLVDIGHGDSTTYQQHLDAATHRTEQKYANHVIHSRRCCRGYGVGSAASNDQDHKLGRFMIARRSDKGLCG